MAPPGAWRRSGSPLRISVEREPFAAAHIESDLQSLVEEVMVTRNPQSTAQIAGHPLHPMLIPFPVAFFVATFVCDVIFWQTGNSAWSTASLYLLGAALIMAALAALAGLTDFLGDHRIRDLSAAWHHMIGNVVVVLLSAWNWYRRYEAGDAAVLPTGLLISLVVVLILLYTGWRGWEMVYKHRVAVSEQGD
jgi:uncharacterized membrane protein